MLSRLGLSLAEYARYSSFLYFPLLFYIPGLLQLDVGALESRSRRSRVLDTTSSSPLTRSSLEVPRQEALPFRSSVDLVLAFLRQPCTPVSVLRYYCFR